MTSHARFHDDPDDAVQAALASFEADMTGIPAEFQPRPKEAHMTKDAYYAGEAKAPESAIGPLRKALSILNIAVEQVQTVTGQIAGPVPENAEHLSGAAETFGGLFGELDMTARQITAYAEAIRNNMDRVQARL